jgi:hypothetical protein
MALSGSALGALIDANLSSAGAIGANKTVFSNALGNGIVNHILGKGFVTADTGTTPGSGNGIGVGIVGLTSANMVTTAIGVMSSTGTNAIPMMQAIMDAVVTHLATATLTSTHSPVVIGTGAITVGTITVTTPGMDGTISAALTGAGATGSNAPNLSLAIATGIVTEILAAGTGSVVITGPPPGTPVPGSGAGIGTIS